jgi:hypothetical protein
MITLHSDSRETSKMMRVLFVGQIPETVDYSDPALPPGLNAEKIMPASTSRQPRSRRKAGLGIICNIAPDDEGIATLEKQLASTTYDCVVVGGGLRLRPQGSVDVRESRR